MMNDSVHVVDQVALSFLQAKKTKLSFSHYDVWFSEHAKSFTVAKMMDHDLLNDVQACLSAAIEQGWGFEKFKSEIKPYLMKQGWWGQSVMIDPMDGEAKIVQLGSNRRLKLIFDTNRNTAAAVGYRMRIEQNKKLFPYLKYMPSKSIDPREVHKAFYGLILPVDHPFWDTHFPPNGYNCKCTVKQLTRRQAMREREKDIMADMLKQKVNPSYISAFTQEQLEDYMQGKLPDDSRRAEMLKKLDETVENPRTGEEIKAPFMVTPTFAYNPIKSLQSIDALFFEKLKKNKPNQALNAWHEFVQSREDYLFQKSIQGAQYLAPDLKIIQAGKVGDKEAIQRLQNENIREHEAVTAYWIEKALNCVLTPFNGDLNGKNPDFVIQSGKLKGKTVDVMFSVENDAYRITHFNQNFLRTTKKKGKVSSVWEEKKDNIQKHLQKADIVPLDMRYLNTENQQKILSYVLSLPENQRRQFIVIVKESE